MSHPYDNHMFPPRRVNPAEGGMQTAIGLILGRLDSIETTLREQYQPDPDVALAQRTNAPFRHENVVAEVSTLANGGRRYNFVTTTVDTHGFSLQNCFAVVTILEDSVPGTGLAIEGVLEGSNGSTMVPLDTGIVGQVNYNGPDTYAIPLLTNGDSLSTNIRFRLFLYDNTGNNPTRRIRYNLDGMLCAGRQF